MADRCLILSGMLYEWAETEEARRAFYRALGADPDEVEPDILKRDYDLLPWKAAIVARLEAA